MSSTLNIAVSGLNDAVTRIANATSNIVNASSTGQLPTDAGGTYTGYQPHDVVTISNSSGPDNLGVTSQLVPRDPAYVTAPDPTSPNANAQGLVGAPNVDIASELVNVNGAQISYDANAKVISISEKMQKTLLDAIT